MRGTHPTPCQKGTPNTHIWPWEEQIQSYMSERSNTHMWPWEEPIQSSMSERPSTYIWPCEEPILPTCWKSSALTSDHVRNQSNMSEGLCTYIWSCCKKSHSHIRMDLHLYLIMWEHITQSHQNGSTLIMWEHIPQWHQNVSILIMWEHIPQSHQNISALTSDHGSPSLPPC